MPQFTFKIPNIQVLSWAYAREPPPKYRAESREFRLLLGDSACHWAYSNSHNFRAKIPLCTSVYCGRIKTSSHLFGRREVLNYWRSCCQVPSYPTSKSFSNAQGVRFQHISTPAFWRWCHVMSPSKDLEASSQWIPNQDSNTRSLPEAQGTAALWCSYDTSWVPQQLVTWKPYIFRSVPALFELSWGRTY